MTEEKTTDQENNETEDEDEDKNGKKSRLEIMFPPLTNAVTQVMVALIGLIGVIIGAIGGPMMWNLQQENEMLQEKIASLENQAEIQQNQIDELQSALRNLIAPVDSVVTWKKNGHQYWVCNESVSWTRARKDCELLGGHLLTITTREEQEFVNQNLLASGRKNAYWIGATDEELEGDWQWVTGEDWGYTNWRTTTNEPSNSSYIDNLEENYGLIYRENGTWNDVMPEGDKPEYNTTSRLQYIGYICEWDNAESIIVR